MLICFLNVFWGILIDMRGVSLEAKTPTNHGDFGKAKTLTHRRNQQADGEGFAAECDQMSLMWQIHKLY